LKKSPGFTVLKYSLAAIIEFGISLLAASEITIELKIFENKTPQANATDKNRITFFIVLLIYYKCKENL